MAFGHGSRHDSQGHDERKAPSGRRPVLLAAVIAFSVIMVASLMLPSLSAIFASKGSGSRSAATTGSSTTAAATSSKMDAVDSRYEGSAQAARAKLDDSDDQGDLANLLTAANAYFAWGYQAAGVASTDDEQLHARDLLTKAMGYYDRYLALNDASTARVDRALCQYYLGDTQGAVSALEQLTQADAGCAPAWANLGMMYQAASETDKAKDAFTRALAADPDDKYGVKSYCTKQLDSINSAAATTGAAATTSSLAGDLAGDSGTRD